MYTAVSRMYCRTLRPVKRPTCADLGRQIWVQYPEYGGSWCWSQERCEWVDTSRTAPSHTSRRSGQHVDPIQGLMTYAQDPIAYYQGLAYPSGDDSDGLSDGGSSHGIVEHMRVANISSNSAPHAASFASADDAAAPLPRGGKQRGAF